MRAKTLPLIFIIGLAVAFTFHFIAIAATDAPHNASNNISCGSCHGETIMESPFWGTGTYDQLCLSCHRRATGGPYSQTDAPAVTTHSDSSGSALAECRDCHNPHYQRQKVYKNTDASNLYLATGKITSCEYSGKDPLTNKDISTFHYSDNPPITYKSGTGWDATKLPKKTEDYRGAILFPNVNKLGYNYPITAVNPTAKTITVNGNLTTECNLFSSATFAAMYGQYIKDVLNTKTVKFFDQTGTNSFADGDTTYNGVCEVCHTRLNIIGMIPQAIMHIMQPIIVLSCHSHTNGFAHGGSDCVECHGHDPGYEYETGKYSQGKGTFGSHSTHNENDSDDLKGPYIACGDCHDTNKFPYFKSGTDSNSDGKYDLSETDVCNTCHSPDGTYDGVNNGTYGAKANWSTGVYTGNVLTSGKEKWCAGCHDESPGNSKPDGSGVNAPNVIGDEDGTYPYGTGWGYYKTGHGLLGGTYPASEAPAARKVCLDCHDSTKAHIDDNPRTYSAASDNYKAGYRLKDINGGPPMDIPRTDWDGIVASDFALCFECHDSDLYTGSTNFTTNFREDLTYNSHEDHLQTGGAYTDRWDSDWDGTTGDSQISCPACHNVHGSPSPRMVRHGELISTPGTTDKVPSLDFKYTPETYPTLLNSTGGKTGFLTGGAGTIENTGICSMCHNRMVGYIRTPNDVHPPRITHVYGKAGSNSLKVVFSEGVYTNTGAVGDLTIGDFTLTDTDNSRTITNVIHTAGDDIATLILSSPLDSTDDIGTDTLAAASASSIYDASDNPMGTTPVTISSDNDLPTISSQDPANSATNISIAKDLTFTLSDSDSGVDFTTFSIQLSGDKGYSKTYTDTDTSVVSKTGSRAEYDVTVAPDANFGTGEVITGTVNVNDVAGNSLTPPDWSFTTEATPTPQTITLHPSDIASNPGGYSTYGGAWSVILDSNDGDTTYAYSGTGAQGAIFYMDMDDPTGLGSVTIQSLTFHVYARYVSGFSPTPPPSPGVIDIGYKTGVRILCWKGDTSIDGSGNYNLVSSSTYTTDSDGGALDLTDINNLQISVKRRTSGSCPLRVTEVYVKVTYLPLP